MKKFNELEKAVLRSFVKGQKQSLNYMLINMYGDLFHQHQVMFDSSHPTQLTFYRPMQTLDHEEILATERMVIDISFLIKYLERENLIHLFQQGNGLTHVGSVQTGGGNVPICKNIDPSVADVLKEAMSKCVIASQELIDFVDNDFRTIEDENLILTKKALTVSAKSYKIALGALVAAIVIPIIAAWFIPVTINDAQFDILTKIIQSLKQ